MQVMVLAAGRSTRLGALGLALPKPLVPICGHPAIAFGLGLCAHAGLTDVVVNLHHHADLVREALGDGSRHGVDIRYSTEADLLGTGGGLVQARALFRSEPVLIINGKIVVDVDLGAVIAAHHAAPAGTVATMVVRDDPRRDDWAPVIIDAAGRVVGLRGAGGPGAPEGETNKRMFTGIHIVERALLDRLPAGVSDVIGEAYLPALTAGDRIQSFTMNGYFAEHSTPERYLEGNLALLRRPSLVQHPPGPLVGVDPSALVHPTATVAMPCRIDAGATIESGACVGPDVVVGRGGRVAAGVRIERAVVWEKATARESCADTVVTAV